MLNFTGRYKHTQMGFFSPAPLRVEMCETTQKESQLAKSVTPTFLNNVAK